MHPEQDVHEQFRSSVRRAARSAEFMSMAAEGEASHTCPREVFTWAAEHGLMGLNFPAEFGGSAGDKVASCIVAEELGYVSPALAGMIMGQSGVATEALLRHGSPAQQALLPEVFAGRTIIGIAITEPDTGSNISGTTTVATPDGDGYILNGAKTFISYASIGDYICVLARIKGTTGRDGLALFLVDTRTAGYVLGKTIEKLGQHAADTGEFALQDAFVPADALIGEVGQGFAYLQESLTSGRIDHAARSVGMIQACLDEAISYAKVRAPFGTPIADYQATKFKLARMATELETSRAMAYRAAAMFDAEPHSSKTGIAAAMAKVVTSEALQRVSWEALQIHGAFGYTTEFRIEQLYRDARVTTLAEGTTEVQMLLISRDLLAERAAP